ncbi:right-handed parallel beta-helix repeat-containing protein [Paenibacillus oceani]|uniref:Right-handed parallel beta-helix repeat-containing protein n=1 Tax=Paenibacillus oceani TaxID=2772510 RepID=A0A927CC25_9BACL|nr:right-handed parallel beta-helix repeat-containing protein [Paenibacillus oceani]MBD2864900.1 right-handed parallel beta-helix repeat-containing protein [Paenibacillus oceani]
MEEKIRFVQQGMKAVTRRRFLYGLTGLGAVMAAKPVMSFVGQGNTVTGATYGGEVEHHSHDHAICHRYASIAAMKQDMHLSAGMLVCTVGYYEAGDGGCAEYIIQASSLPDDGGSVIHLQNGLQAILIACEQINCKQFGAVGDGAADDTAALQAAIDVAIVRSKPLRAIQGETYKISSPLVINGSLDADFVGVVIDATELPAATSLNQIRAIYVTGSIGASTSVTTNIPSGSSQVALTSTAGLSAGDLLLLSSDQPMMDGYGRVGSKRGELQRIFAVDSATQLTLAGQTSFSYAAASNTIVRRIVPVVQPRLRNLNIICGGVRSGHSGIRIDYAVQFELDNVSIDGGEDSGIQTFYCDGGTIRNGTVRNSTSPAAIPNVTTGYGVVLYNATRYVIIDGVTFRNCRRGVTGGNLYPAIHCTIKHCRVEGGKNGLGNHEPCFWWLIHDNTVTNVDEVGFLIRGQYTKVYRNQVFGARGHGIRIRTYYPNPQGVEGTELIDNVVTNVGYYGIYLDGDATDGRVGHVQIRGGRLHNCGAGSIYGRRCSDVLIDGVECKGQTTLFATDGNGIYFNGSAAEGDRCKGITISNVYVPAPLRNGLQFRYCDNIEIANSRVTDAASYGINVLHATQIGITGGFYEANGNNYCCGIYVKNSSGIRVSGVSLAGALSNTGSHAIVCTAASPETSTDHEITGCRMSNFNKAVYIFDTGANHSVVTGNNARACSSGTKFDIASSSQVMANNLI